jgi:hypothetical protein
MTTASPSDHVVPVESGRDRLRILRGASVALYTLLSLDLVLTVVAFRDEVDRHSLYQRVKSKPWTVTLAEARAVEHRVDTVNAISLVLFVATAVGFAVWLWAAYSRLGELGYDRRHGSGWAIGAWFLPVANLFMPRRIVNDLVDAEVSRHGETMSTVSLRRWTTAWWMTWLVAIGVGCVVNSMNSRAQTVDAALSASVGFMVRCVAFAAAAVLAIVAVRLVTRQQRELTSVR